MFRLAWSLVLSLALGCSAFVSPDEDRLGGPDGPPVGSDGGIVIVDGGPPPGTDGGGGGTDSGPGVVDSGPPPDCTAGPATCDGDVLVECVGGVERRTNCVDEEDFCAAGAAGASCQPWVCDPGRTRCDDGNVLVTCDARGSRETREMCPGECVSGDGGSRCADAPPICAGATMITPGSMTRFDLCAESNDSTFTPMGDCGSGFPAGGGDRVFTFTLSSETTVLLNLRDDDRSEGIDTVLYLRSACEDASSQIACADDVRCDSSSIMTGCSGGVQVRESRINRTLPAGTYYVIADHFEYSGFGCGDVLLSFFTGATGVTP